MTLEREKKKRKEKVPTPNPFPQFCYKQTNSTQMASFLRSVVATTTTATAVAALAFSSSSSSFSHSQHSPNTALSSNPKSNKPSRLVKTFATSPSPLVMDHNLSPHIDHHVLPELLVSFT